MVAPPISNLFLPAVLELPDMTVRQSKIESGVAKVVNKVRPDWNKEDIILQKVATEAGNNSVFMAYTLEGKEQRMMVKVLGTKQQKQDQVRVSLQKLSSEK